MSSWGQRRPIEASNLSRAAGGAAPFSGFELRTLRNGHADEAHAFRKMLEPRAYELRMLHAHVWITAAARVGLGILPVREQPPPVTLQRSFDARLAVSRIPK